MSPKDAYHKLWSGENAAEPYLEWLARDDEGRSAREPFLLSMVDVMLSGDTEHYELYSPCREMALKDFHQSDEVQDWLQSATKQLSTFKPGVATRIIVFSTRADITIRNLLGTKYSLRPEFLADIQHQNWMANGSSSSNMDRTSSLHWPGAYQTFRYATGTAANHLKFENGFIACVLKDIHSNSYERKNVGTSRSHTGVVSKLI